MRASDLKFQLGSQSSISDKLQAFPMLEEEQEKYYEDCLFMMLPGITYESNEKFKQVLKNYSIPDELEHLFESFNQEMMKNDEDVQKAMGCEIHLSHKIQFWHISSQRFLEFDEIGIHSLRNLVEGPSHIWVNGQIFQLGFDNYSSSRTHFKLIEICKFSNKDDKLVESEDLQLMTSIKEVKDFSLCMKNDHLIMTHEVDHDLSISFRIIKQHKTDKFNDQSSKNKDQKEIFLKDQRVVMLKCSNFECVLSLKENEIPPPKEPNRKSKKSDSTLMMEHYRPHLIYYEEIRISNKASVNSLWIVRRVEIQEEIKQEPSPQQKYSSTEIYLQHLVTKQYLVCSDLDLYLSDNPEPFSFKFKANPLVFDQITNKSIFKLSI